MSRFPLGQPVRQSTTVRQLNTDGTTTLVNPGTLTLLVKLANADGTTLTTGTYSSPTNDGTGLYHQDIPVTDLAATGHYQYTWTSTGTGAGVSFGEFADLVGGGGRTRRRGAPLLGFAQAGADGYFDDAGFPAGEGWEEIELPAGGPDDVYALEISGDSMRPVYRDGDRIIVQPATDEPRRGDRVVVKTTNGEVMAKEVARITATRLELASLNPDYEGRILERSQIAWIARILWASQ